MSRSRSKSPSRSGRHSSSRSQSSRSKKNRYRSPDRSRSHKSSKHRNRSDSESPSDSSTSRYKSSSKHKSSRRSHKRRHNRRSSSSSTSSSSSSRSSSSSSRSRSSSPGKLHKNRPSSSYADKIRLIRTPSPPKLTFSSTMDYLDNRQTSDVIDEINADQFVPKTFNSATNTNQPKGSKNDLDIKIKGEPKITKFDMNDDPLFHKNVFGDDEERMEKWVRKMYNFRQKTFAGTN